ncbi:glutamine-synthetase adenylyltransferase [Actibacterium sp. 188UL27-1]|uniref:[protein-PII] uridylyltransferase family protein n=1 Tax=Actibacterium sp. 188UL27-1 TaxID=2786961 RepID=UPI001957E93A|nr:glutamine-synthetase adenylyltransferase [Actibacterium sp. 188UL27-1]MBM7066715.1 glutamine-synthetase adenylyltransferase [Actibacterium sp. 188UL27-1]
MSPNLASRIIRTPLPFDAEAAADIADLYPDQVKAVADLLMGTAGCSLFLRGLLEKERTWLAHALTQDPVTVADDILADLSPRPEAELRPALRRAKRRMALWVALMDLGGVWTLQDVTAALTNLADHAVDTALKSALLVELNRGKVPGDGPDDLTDAAGVTVLAMGKMGAGELNYSSDIDLIFLFDNTRFTGPDVGEARAAFIRATRKTCAMLSDITADGYVFRTDLRLRPDAAVTPVCVAIDAAEQYYESVGRTWERAAFIKARACAGNIAVGAAFIDRLRPFVWRRHLDFAAIQDAYDMRKAIRDHKGLHGDRLDGRDLKLGRGGIREIEFFTQTRQLIAGGRDATLRSARTVDALRCLAEGDWIDHQTADALIADYRSHREVEHRLQMVADAQTHLLPKSEQGFDRIARMMGQGDTGAFRAELRTRLDRVAGLTEAFFRPDNGAAAPRGDDPPIVKGWARYPAMRSARAVEIFERLKPDLLKRLGEATKPEEAFAAFDGFLSGLPAGVQIFSLFEANPKLRAMIVDIAATAPPLARYLSRHSRVLDAVIGGDFFAPWPDQLSLQAGLGAALQAAPDYEAQLDAARLWAKEWHFRIGVHHLRGLTDATQAGAQYADLAQSVLAALYPAVLGHLARRHGAPPGRGAVILAMGSLGGGWLNAHSDLDLIVIYDADGNDTSDGPRPLAARPYYARLTQSLITALSAPTAQGKLYDVDMRLRPSGKQGPVATSLAAFQRYHAEEAWTWEHLALTLARPVAGPEQVQVDVAAARRAILGAPHDRAQVLSDLVDMRARLASQAGQLSAYEAKLGAGRAQDIALLAQTAAVLSGQAAGTIPEQLLQAAGWIPDDSIATLTRMHNLCRSVQSAGRLVADGAVSDTTLGQGGAQVLLRETGQPDLAKLNAHLTQLASECDRIITDALAAP